MKSLVGHVKTFFEVAFDLQHNHHASILLIEDPEHITYELIKAKHQRRVIGLHSTKLGTGIILAKIEDVADGRVLLRLLDLEGAICDVLEIDIKEIQGVSPFNTSFSSAVKNKKLSAVYANHAA